ncbi:restriction endonuclease subunit S [Pseudobutyrivibrio sp.]|uniref:restriction endonuclease subunit S n=1 Tax=Pseudobutyrivibrio sp. TaxID=2014367 RepID=UPI0025D2C4DF|nr:restriction endonuclease subunit S [Pseudobutyrivibrio sp.]
MNLNISGWKSFFLKDIYNIRMGNGFDKNKLDLDTPEVNLVSRQSYNNGVDVKVGLVNGTQPFEAGLVTVALGGSYLGSCFVQLEPFYTAQNVAVMKPKYKEMTDEVNNFISGLVRYESSVKYYAFGRELNTHIRTDFEVKLPVDEDDNPDWQFMKDYIKSLHHKPLTTKNKSVITPKLNVNNWKEFRVGDLFDIHPTKAIEGVNSEECNGYGVPLVVNQSNNNGVTGLCDYPPSEKGGIITFSDTWEGETFFYQPDDFVGFAHVQGMYPKMGTLSGECLLFISTILEFEARGRYSYGRKKRRDIIKNVMIKLPADSNGNPDWEFMENYIKSLPYGDRLEG